MSVVDDLRAALAAHDQIIDQAIAMIKGLHDQLSALAPDNSVLASVRDDLAAKAKALSDAINGPAPVDPPVQ